MGYPQTQRARVRCNACAARFMFCYALILLGFFRTRSDAFERVRTRSDAFGRVHGKPNRINPQRLAKIKIYYLPFSQVINFNKNKKKKCACARVRARCIPQTSHKHSLLCKIDLKASRMRLDAFFGKGISEHTKTKNRASAKAWFDGWSNPTHLSEIDKGQKRASRTNKNQESKKDQKSIDDYDVIEYDRHS